MYKASLIVPYNIFSTGIYKILNSGSTIRTSVSFYLKYFVHCFVKPKMWYFLCTSPWCVTSALKSQNLEGLLGNVKPWTTTTSETWSNIFDKGNSWTKNIRMFTYSKSVIYSHLFCSESLPQTQSAAEIEWKQSKTSLQSIMCSTFISEASDRSSEYLYVNENSQPMTDKTVNCRAACLDNKLIYIPNNKSNTPSLIGP